MVHSARGKGKSRPRIIYWFRTPPGVKVGRDPLDEEALRLLEASHPDIEFDWPQLLKGKPDASVDRARPDSGGRDRIRPVEKPDRRDRQGRAGRAPDRRGPGAAPEPPSERTISESPAPAPVLAPTGPAAARLGSEALTRLRARFADISARIRDRVEDEPRRAELNSLAERLNPDAWSTDDEVAAGIESYESTFETLKTAIGGRRKAAAAPVPDAPPSDVDAPVELERDEQRE